MFVGFDANGDTNPVTDRVGLSGRNTYYGDDLYSWDLRVARYFAFRERYRVDLMVDAFNALNRPNVDEVTSVYGAAVFCGPTPKRYKDAATIATQEAVAAFDAGTGPPTCPLNLRTRPGASGAQWWLRHAQDHAQSAPVPIRGQVLVLGFLGGRSFSSDIMLPLSSGALAREVTSSSFSVTSATAVIPSAARDLLFATVSF